MEEIQRNTEKYLSTVSSLLRAEGMNEADKILRESRSRIEETGYDNWNGGTRIWTLYLEVSPDIYSSIKAKRENIQEQIGERIKTVIEPMTDDWISVSIVPKIAEAENWREVPSELPLQVRRNIIDGMKIEKTNWAGELDEVEFLARLYDLEKMPSHDTRFSNASGDIWQHRINNPYDWDDDWIYEDSRFNLMKAPTNEFLKFLCEIVHPVVRPDRNESLKLVEQFNDQLRRVGWRIVEQEKIGGRPRFVAQHYETNVHRSVTRAQTVADALDSSWMKKEIERLENAIDSDPALAIGTAKELVETCCKTILTKCNVEFTNSTTLPQLTKLVTTELKLVPDGISEKAKGAETIKLILRNFSAQTQYLAELRSHYGTGHGRDGKHRGLQPRHARLAASSAIAFVDFITDTYRERTASK